MLKISHLQQAERHIYLNKDKYEERDKGNAAPTMLCQDKLTLYNHRSGMRYTPYRGSAQVTKWGQAYICCPVFEKNGDPPQEWTSAIEDLYQISPFFTG